MNMQNVMGILGAVVVAAIVLVFSILVMKQSSHTASEKLETEEMALFTEYSVGDVKIEKADEFGRQYRYSMTIHAKVKSENDTSLIPVLFYKYHYFRCEPLLEIHLEKGKLEEFECRLDFTTDYSPTIDECKGNWSLHETVKCGNISLMMEDVIDIKNDIHVFRPKGVGRWFSQYIEKTKAVLEKLSRLDPRAEKKLKRFAALIIVNNGISQLPAVVEYDETCGQCDLKVDYKYMHGSYYANFYGSCGDEEYIREMFDSSDIASIEKVSREVAKDDCTPKDDNAVNIEMPGARARISIGSAKYYQMRADIEIGSRLENIGIIRNAGFSDFEMETWGGKLNKALAPIDILYIKPGCTMLSSATDSESIYKAMDLCKDIAIVKKDRIWVKDVIDE